MAASNLVVDTCVFIEYLRAKNKSKTTLYAIPDGVNLFLSSVTLYELHMGAINEEKKNDVRTITNDLRVLSFNDEIAICAAEIFHSLRKANQLVEFRDIFIAATCLIHQMPLKTLNIKHFNRIAGIEFA